MLWKLPAIKPQREGRQYDVVVVGASISGLVCTLKLVEDGLNVALVESSVFPGSGDSGRGSLSCTLGLTDNIWRLSQSLGTERLLELLNIQNEALNWLKTQLHITPKGSYHLAMSAREEEELFESADLLEQAGFKVERCEAQRCSEQLGIELNFGGYYRQADGFLNPVDVFSKLLEGISTAATFPQTTVLDIHSSNSGFTVHTSREQLNTELVVICAGLGSRAIDPFFEERLSSVRTQYTTFQAPHKLTDELFEAQYGYQQWFKQQNALVFSGCRWATPHLEIGEETELLSPAISKAQERSVRKMYPGTGSKQNEWSLLQTHTCDGLPFVGGLPGRDNLLTVCGFQGKQGSLGIGSALALCNALTGDGSIPYWLQARRF